MTNNCKNPKVCRVSSECELYLNMRDVWAKHVWWTREVIMGIVHGLPGTADVRVPKLLQNPAEMASVFAPYCMGDLKGSCHNCNNIQRLRREVRERRCNEQMARLTDLFTTHLKQGGDVVTAAKAGDTQKTEQLVKQWYANADDIAKFFAEYNACYDEKMVKDMMYEHLRLTIAEAVYEIGGQYQASINMFDQIQKEAQAMADYFACGTLRA